jgi:hypothetical protein
MVGDAPAATTATQRAVIASGGGTNTRLAVATTSDLAGEASPTDTAGVQKDPPSPAAVGKGNSWESAIRLPDIVAHLQEILPESWEVAGIQHNQTPRKWAGAAQGILIRLENPAIVAYHPNGFEYHPYYKIWLCPTLWKGSSEDVRFLEENDWSVLLGQNHKMKVFYLTQGANDWREGPDVLRKALDLTALPITRALRQKIDPAVMMKVFPRLAVSANGQAGLLDRVVGLEMEGPLAYVEYATATAGNGSSRKAAAAANGTQTTNGNNGGDHDGITTTAGGDVATGGAVETGGDGQPSGRVSGQPAGPNQETNGQGSLSRCMEPAVASLMERENLSLANQILLAYPQVQTVYVRVVCDEFASDMIINRPTDGTQVPAPLSDSSR